MNQQEEQIVADAWGQAILKFIPVISERNHVNLEKEEQKEILRKIF